MQISKIIVKLFRYFSYIIVEIPAAIQKTHAYNIAACLSYSVKSAFQMKIVEIFKQFLFAIP